ncbi:MAG: beta-phosphoglucomutase [Lachnospiraceae bacterium]|nr:beta-phosphoglucomutase [Lachnospiraceae bacterium]
MQKIKAALFDLDGVLVDTAKYHYLAWKRLARELGFEFTKEDNEALKGVSRMKSLDILLSVGGLTFDEETKKQLATKKNAWYVEYLEGIDESELLKNVENTLKHLRACGIRTAIGSASKNTPLILKKTGLDQYFDAVVDGNDVSKAKPDPEVFLLGAQRLGCAPKECMVFEDSLAGIQAANTAGMFSIYLGSTDAGSNADMVIRDMTEFHFPFE